MTSLNQVFHLVSKSNRLVLQYLSSCRYFGSVLYVTGDKATEMYSVITPHIDIEERFRKINSLKENVELRGMQTDVEKIKDVWEILKSVQADKKTLENRRMDIASKIKMLKKDSDTEKELEKLKFQGKLLRDDLKTTMKTIWELEKNCVIKILNLPNDLHVDTPEKDPKIICQFGSEPNLKKTESHLKIGEKLDILEYINSMCYYLKGNAALFELNVLHYFTEQLCQKKFVKFCNSDFVRSVVVEGCGQDHEDPSVTHIIQDTEDMLQDENHLHLIGGASLQSFCSFHAKQIIPSSALPLRLMTIGRQYVPDVRTEEDSNHLGLFNVCQNSSVEIFISTKDSFEEMMIEFDKALANVTEIYKTLDFPFRVLYLPAKSLKSHECLRASFQMFSSYLQSYVEVGNISCVDSYISKRLLIRYEADAELRFTRIVCGTVLSVPKLLGCILELYPESETFKNIPIPNLRNVLL